MEKKSMAIILIKDGDIKEVYSNKEIDYCIIDPGQVEPILGIHVTEKVNGDLKELFHPDSLRPGDNPEQFKFIYDTLKEEGF